MAFFVSYHETAVALPRFAFETCCSSMRLFQRRQLASNNKNASHAQVSVTPTHGNSSTSNETTAHKPPHHKASTAVHAVIMVVSQQCYHKILHALTYYWYSLCSFAKSRRTLTCTNSQSKCSAAGRKSRNQRPTHGILHQREPHPARTEDNLRKQKYQDKSFKQSASSVGTLSSREHSYRARSKSGTHMRKQCTGQR